jgi:Ran GTPase-activating protein (RanGAP) involved in mRNA processing and transport
MTNSGTVKILKSLNHDGLYILDLSENRVGDEAMNVLVKGISSRNSTLVQINLEHSFLSNRAVSKLC